MQDSLKILETVNNFYSQSFGHLITITVAVLAFSGIILPILVTIYQKRLFKLEHEVIENSLIEKMKAELEIAVKEIKAEYDEKEKILKSKLSEMEDELNRKFDNAKGGICHVQGCSNFDQQRWFSAFESFVNASIFFIKGKDNLNLRRVTNMINENCLPNLNANDIEHNIDTFNCFEKFLEDFATYDSDDVFTDQINSLRYQFYQCKNRNIKANGTK
ncbi:hypothetical protein [Psychromonas sp. L1A2]|uniref:hypothetical protein n=1 Tax=Psychromonas sp. L1A2 TaxID=2686356 RepID=UPI00135CC582|nr:hypothetical protein [Psychromonas sp. L1A2]